MLPFGTLGRVEATGPKAVSFWMDGLERAGCEVAREGERRLSVRVPDWEAAWLAFEPVAWAQRGLWDRIILTVGDDGVARFKLEYFSSARLLMHALVTAFFASEAWFGAIGAGDRRAFVLGLLAAQLVPVGVTLASFGFARRRLVRGMQGLIARKS